MESNEQKAESVHLEAVVDIQEEQMQLGSKKLVELQRFAKNAAPQKSRITAKRESTSSDVACKPQPRSSGRDSLHFSAWRRGVPGSDVPNRPRHRSIDATLSARPRDAFSGYPAVPATPRI